MHILRKIERENLDGDLESVKKVEESSKFSKRDFYKMGRGRGKGKKQTEDLAQRRRGRPQKPLKNDFEEDDNEVSEKIEENSEDGKSNADETETDNGRKRRRSTEAEETIINSSQEVDNGGNTKTSIEKSIISAGFRHIGSRRKNKPRRAAEVGVECN